MLSWYSIFLSCTESTGNSEKLHNFLTLQTCCLVCNLIMPHCHLSCISPCLQFSRHEFSHCPLENLKGKKLLRNYCFWCGYDPAIDSSIDIYLLFLDWWRLLYGAVLASLQADLGLCQALPVFFRHKHLRRRKDCIVLYSSLICWAKLAGMGHAPSKEPFAKCWSIRHRDDQKWNRLVIRLLLTAEIQDSDVAARGSVESLWLVLMNEMERNQGVSMLGF